MRPITFSTNILAAKHMIVKALVLSCMEWLFLLTKFKIHFKNLICENGEHNVIALLHIERDASEVLQPIKIPWNKCVEWNAYSSKKNYYF